MSNESSDSRMDGQCSEFEAEKGPSSKILDKKFALKKKSPRSVKKQTLKKVNKYKNTVYV